MSKKFMDFRGNTMRTIALLVEKELITLEISLAFVGESGVENEDLGL